MKAILQIGLQRYVLLIIIVLLISVLVVISILKDRILITLGIVNPYIEEKALQKQCEDKCTSWCAQHIGETGTKWEDIRLLLPRGEVECVDVLKSILGDDIGTCECGSL